MKRDWERMALDAAWALVVVLAVTYVWARVSTAPEVSAWEASCRAAGGYPHIPRDYANRICLRVPSIEVQP